MVTEHDTVILLSYSGETDEVTRLLPHLSARGIPTIALSGHASSRLATGADIFLDVGVDREVCPNNLAPTSSTLAQLAMGDALAVALVRLRGFEAADFARLHPGGGLGRKLTARVRDAMITEMPVVERAASAKECVLALARGRCPFVLVQHDDELCGIVGEPEIRRALESSDACLDTPVASIMNPEPAVIEAGALIGVAERRMERERVDALVVVDVQGQVCGVLPRSEVG
jgi:arabinose-5-phosphate isomerase